MAATVDVHNALRFLRSLLSSLRPTEPDVELEERDCAPAAPEQAAQPATVEPPQDLFADDGFDGLMDHLGAEAVSPEEAALAIRDATIEGLNHNLQQLRSLGDTLAESEKERLRLIDLVSELQVEHDKEIDALDRQIAGLAASVEKKERSVQREKDRRASMREKYEERKRVAGSRWFELRELRAERSRLMRELGETQRQLEEATTLANRPRPRVAEGELARLLDPNPDDARDAAARKGTPRRIEG